MVTKQTTDIQTIAQRLAELVRDDPAVRELWISSRDGVPELVLFTDDIDDEHERELYRLAGMLRNEYPDARFSFGVDMPVNYPAVARLSEILPTNAVPVPLLS